MKYCVFILSFFIFSGCIFSQNSTIDSLNRKAHELRDIDPVASLQVSSSALILADNDTLNSAFIYTLRNIAMALRNIAQYEKSLLYLNRGVTISKKIDDIPSLSNCYSNLASVYKSIGKTQSAIHYIQMSLQIDIELRDTSGIALNMNNLAELYVFSGDYDYAIELYMQSAQMELKTGNMYGAAECYNNLATVLYEIGESEKALTYLYKALKIYEQIHSEMDIAMVCNNIAHLLALEKKPQLAMPYVTRSISIRLKHNDMKGLAYSYVTMGIVHQAQHSYLDAEQWFFRGMNLALEIGDYRLLSTGFYDQAMFYLEIQDTTNAIMYFQNSLEFAREMQYKELTVEILTTLIDLSVKSTDFESAFKYQSELISLENSIDTIPENMKMGKFNDVNVEAPMDKINIYLSFSLLSISFLCLFMIFILYRKLRRANQIIQSRTKRI